MNTTASPATATTIATRFAQIGGRHIAYRELGAGTPLLLCLRFRGVLDSWDPAFLDRLAADFRVITFDYSGLGQSSGEASYRAEALARDAIDLADALGLERFVIGGWSLGGMAAQVVAALVPERVSHLVLIGTTPPGRLEHPPEPVFFERALKPENDLDDETVLFFEPLSARSRAAAAASHLRIAARSADRSPPIAPEVYLRLLKDRSADDLFPDTAGYRDFLARAGIPILVIAGDHEIIFPTPNWYPLVRDWESLHLLILPRMGHGPHHEAPELVADLITSFARNR